MLWMCLQARTRSQTNRHSYLHMYICMYYIIMYWISRQDEGKIQECYTWIDNKTSQPNIPEGKMVKTFGVK